MPNESSHCICHWRFWLTLFLKNVKLLSSSVLGECKDIVEEKEVTWHINQDDFKYLLRDHTLSM